MQAVCKAHCAAQHLALNQPLMTLRTILIHPDPHLKKVAKPVTKVTDDIRAVARDMLETMYNAPGIGLAAPQIGVLKRMIVIDCVKDDETPPDPIVLLNPTVTWSSEEIETSEEGCLSIPDHFAEIERASEVDVTWLGVDGDIHSQRFDGLWSTCVQHEIDHLNGKLFIDYLKPLKRQMITRRMTKLKREQARA